MKFLANAILFAAVVSAAALPTPANEAEIDALRAQGLSEHAIAARFPHAHNTATLLRRAIDADGEVAPGAFASPNVDVRDVEGHAGLAEGSAEGIAVTRHIAAVRDFIAGVMNGRIATAGNGGVAMKRWLTRRDASGVEEQQRPARWIYHW